MCVSCQCMCLSVCVRLCVGVAVWSARPPCKQTKAIKATATTFTTTTTNILQNKMATLPARPAILYYYFCQLPPAHTYREDTQTDSVRTESVGNIFNIVRPFHLFLLLLHSLLFLLLLLFRFHLYSSLFCCCSFMSFNMRAT